MYFNSNWEAEEDVGVFDFGDKDSVQEDSVFCWSFFLEGESNEAAGARLQNVLAGRNLDVVVIRVVRLQQRVADFVPEKPQVFQADFGLQSDEPLDGEVDDGHPDFVGIEHRRSFEHWQAALRLDWKCPHMVLQFEKADCQSSYDLGWFQQIGHFQSHCELHAVLGVNQRQQRIAVRVLLR